ncbi:hypothetical protein NIES4101_74670 [Calothrix sp. NIES-4101]|nr:hypothetical protein NIES4101_74670 [Calothrix sp. NIES-4101]
MLLAKKALSLALISTAATAIASVSYTGSAQALSMTYNSGTYRDASIKNEGAFSTEVNKTGYETFDFNNGAVPGNDKVKYSFSNGSYSTTAYSGQTGIYSDMWAPAGVKAEVNDSKYLAVFQGNNTIIEALGGKVFNYFGFDAGALSGGNTIEFFKAGTLVKQLTYEMMNSLATVSATQHGGQKNAFFEIFSTSELDNFDKIVLSQVGGGGFETDNHTFRVGKGAYSIPEPGVVFGLATVSGMFLRSRKKQKTA